MARRIVEIAPGEHSVKILRTAVAKCVKTN
jgi:hypothetical protein